MCLFLKDEDNVRRIADKDITVWKVLMEEAGFLQSAYRPSHGPNWQPGGEYDTLLETSKPHNRAKRRPMSTAAPGNVFTPTMVCDELEHGHRVDIGLHSYGSEDKAFDTKWHLDRQASYQIQHREPWRDMPNFKVFRMTIPEGAEFYHDSKRNEFASDRLNFDLDQSDPRIKPQVRGKQADMVIFDDLAT